MKTLFWRFSVGIFLLGLVTVQAQSFTSLYVFGDALSTTNDNTAGSTNYPQRYYGQRYSNGRVWVEVLAQRQGITIATNWSYFDNDSASLVTNLQNFSGPIPSTALVVVWCNCSDIFNLAFNGVTSQTNWSTAINQGQTNELNAIEQLHAKGARTLIMPTPVDLSLVPGFDLEDALTNLNIIHQGSVAYNIAFSNTLNQARALHPDMTIYEPNFFALLNNVITNAASYGLTNAVTNIVFKVSPNKSVYVTNSENIDAVDALGTNYYNTNGLGDNYVYWDYLDPTAKFHEIMADTVQQMISPALPPQIISLSVQGSPAGNTVNTLTLANVPANGLNGFVDGLTYTNDEGSTGWKTLMNFSSASPSQIVSFVAPPLPPIAEASGNGNINPGGGGSGGTGSNNSTGSQTNSVPGEVQFYRVRIPLFFWSWP